MRAACDGRPPCGAPECTVCHPETSALVCVSCGRREELTDEAIAAWSFCDSCRDAYCPGCSVGMGEGIDGEKLCPLCAEEKEAE